MNQAGQHCVIRRQQLHDPQIKIASVVKKCRLRCKIITKQGVITNDLKL